MFSQGVVIGQTLYLSGAIGLDPATGTFAGDSVEDQARQVHGDLSRCCCVSMKGLFRL